MNETQLTVTGNLVDDPELRFTPPTSGQPVAKFRIASTPRFRDNSTGEWKDGGTACSSRSTCGGSRPRTSRNP
jgi:single-strand DNA-binding protein